MERRWTRRPLGEPGRGALASFHPYWSRFFCRPVNRNFALRKRSCCSPRLPSCSTTTCQLRTTHPTGCRPTVKCGSQNTLESFRSTKLLINCSEQCEKLQICLTTLSAG